MKQLLLTFAATILLYTSVLAQNAQPDIQGEWIVQGVELTSEMGLADEQLQMLNSLKNGFLNSRFTFNKDQSFRLHFPENIPPFIEELRFLDNKKWKMDNRVILIGTGDDNYSLMGIEIVTRNKKAYFSLQESLFLLEVVRK